MTKSLFCILFVFMSATGANASMEKIHIEGSVPLGPYISSLRNQSAAIEGLIMNDAHKVCPQAYYISIADIEIKFRSSGGKVNLQGEQDSRNAEKTALYLGQPHSTYSADVLCFE
ncbi:MAG: hypothetical protein ACXVCY_06640 [Pseudobdellovibrionaceae bacterium]